MKRLVSYNSNNVKTENVSEPYNSQALDWLKATKSGLHITFKKHDYYSPGEKDKRDLYSVTLRHGRRRYTCTFGQSLNNSGQFLPHTRKRNPHWMQPDAYSILACLEKYDPGTFENFCSECGYDTDSKKAETTYKAVLKQWTAVSRLYAETELDSLRNIN
jgi:hypothetical protein